jgi:ATP-binding cassette subfamily F protein uup
MLRDIRLGFGGTPLLAGADLVVGRTERICLVGRNGSGKSTLLKVAAGLVEVDGGERFVSPDATVRYLPQEPDVSGYSTVADYVGAGLEAGDDPHRARYLAESLGLDGAASPAVLSGGERRRAALARVLAPSPDVLLLDEPTNHLDLSAIEWLESELKSSTSALVLISHDRRFLTNLARATVWLDRGTTRRNDQGFDAFEAWRDGILEQEETIRSRRDRRIAAETEWLHKGVTARRRRNQGRLRALLALREERRADRSTQGEVVFSQPTGARSGEVVIEARDISKSWNDVPAVKRLSLRIRRRERVAIVGPNGCGKTTLVGVLIGNLTPDSGTVRLGDGVAAVTLDQARDDLDPDLTLCDTLTDGRGDTVTVGGERRHVASYLKDFLFLPEQARTPVGALSGGERGRLQLARALARPSNLLVLDEPTNDLDIETLDLLEEMLAGYAGTVLLVSHDRDFIDRVASTVIAWDGGGNWIAYAGGYTDMLAQRGKPVSAKPAASRRAVAGRAPAKVDAPRSPTGSGRLSYKEKYALENLPGRIDALASEIVALRAALADPGLFARDAREFSAMAERLAAAEAERDAAESEWLELEIRRETLERGENPR